jgi:hypothetical protein
MPRISACYGIVVAIYYGDHAPPRFHAIHSGEEAVVSIDNLELLTGGLSRPARALVHQEELRAVWQRAARHEPLGTVDPPK